MANHKRLDQRYLKMHCLFEKRERRHTHTDTGKIIHPRYRGRISGSLNTKNFINILIFHPYFSIEEKIAKRIG